jgi:hypothetical protein
LRAIARGDLQAIKEVGDRLDGKCAQVIERGDVPIDELSDAELMEIARNGSRQHLNEPALICGPVPPGND